MNNEPHPTIEQAEARWSKLRNCHANQPSRRGFLGRLIAGGFGLAVGQAVTVQAATAEEAELLKAPAILPPFPADVQSYCVSVDKRMFSDRRPVTHLKVEFWSTNEEAITQLYRSLHMRSIEMAMQPTR